VTLQPIGGRGRECQGRSAELLDELGTQVFGAG
jgi:hypothetical protein